MGEERDAVAAFVALRHLGGRDTALEGVSQILPGQLTALGESGPSPLTLWSAAAIAGHPIELEPQAAGAQLKQEVMDCIHAWASAYDGLLLRLSGGVDSAILLASLYAMPSAARIACLNYHSPGSNSDERGYARLAAAKAGLELVERELDVDFQLEDVLSVSRTPTPAEQAVCAPFLERAIALVRPKVLLLAGGAAAKAVLKQSEGILALRGRWIEWRSEDGDLEIPALPTLHPSFLLRQPAAKRKSWEDMLILAERADRPPRPK